MRDFADLTDAVQADGVADETIWQLGHPPLRDYLDYVKRNAVCGENADRAALIGEWRKANEYYQELEDSESGIADTAECLELDPALAPLTAEVRSAPWYRRAFDKLPTSFGMVELDKLIVFQKSVTGDFVQSIRSSLGPEPDAESLFRFCLPVDAPNTPVQIRRVGSRRFTFRSHSTDFRFHESVVLEPDQIANYDSIGPVSGAVALVVGFGSNFLNVIRSDKRLLLHNGYHRACALWSLGITHAPCIVQKVDTLDELHIAAKARVAENSDFYFRSHRPPLLRDFFDPRIRKVIPIQRLVRTIEVNFEVRDHLVRE